MKVKMDFDQTQQNLKNPAVSVEKNEAEPLTINFADKRSLAGESESRRLFTPRNKIKTGALGASLCRPRAILRMVSAPC